ncbi:NADPH:quinone oxidoreductase family protein [Bosea sp. (in: a-proteobacteria)]|jgi:NADPH2:quinone reductase|uniref:NADPH:quinone oxidoreductase family protein n=1 Tax=Bosea sp. (in: a-proteobacteria) TaxID=1871050 RepID=UPI002DDCEECD|nr:NADPH:quinone oxidoreductase family protein [Bosea sp. (in: a-proteobacteria)]HEV2512116.1 NADPH:quinone oxidoreductase family protein [Bosea sp. (in: a-proteobacteria)]
MKAWVCRAFQDPFVLAVEDIPVPQPGPGQVQIRVIAAGLNFGETLVLKGTYQKTPPLPYVPVSEMAGIVTACGEGVNQFKLGDAVSAFSFSLEGGGLAEYAVMPQAFVFAKPDTISFEQAAAYPINYWTCFNALENRGGLKAGETLVVHGAAGGIGVAAVQLGKAMGATVIGTGSDDGRLAQVRALGADHVINLRTENARDRIKELTGGRGADVYLDPVGGEAFELSMRAIAPGGRILVVGFTSGLPALAKTNVLLVKMISIIGVEARLAIETTGGRGMADYHRMLGWIEDGRISPHVGCIYAFEDVIRGYEDILARRTVGKNVVRISKS